MKVRVHEDKAALGRAAAEEGAEAIRAAIAAKGSAAVVIATGASQFEMLEVLVRAAIDWTKVTAFHLDEYVGISSDHPASFRRYLDERFVRRVGKLGGFVSIDGDAADLEGEVARLNDRISRQTVDVCFAGVGENCHLAFNDPPADFETDAPFIVVELDEACRRQQVGEGWFATPEDVPRRAVSMSVRQIMKSAKLILSVPDGRKADAVYNAVEGPVSNLQPASIAQRHPDCSLHLDRQSAGRLTSVEG